MGIKGLHHLYKRKVGYPPLSTDEIIQRLGSNKIWVDLLGTFYNFFLESNEVGWAHTMRILEPFLLNGNEICIVVDASAVSQQKMDTHLARRVKQSKIQIKIAKKRRAARKRRNANAIHRLQRNVVQFGHLDKDAVFASRPLDIAPSVTIVQARFEADVMIGIQQELEDVVISSDSDLVAYSNTNIVLKVFQDQFQWMEKNELLAALNVDAAHFMWLCSISGNDYAPNIPSIGINTAIRHVLRKHSFDQVLQSLTNAYPESAPEYVPRFRVAEELFRLGNEFEAVIPPVEVPPEGPHTSFPIQGTGLQTDEKPGVFQNWDQFLFQDSHNWMQNEFQAHPPQIRQR
jgi:hypothetical protein